MIGVQEMNAPSKAVTVGLFAFLVSVVVACVLSCEFIEEGRWDFVGRRMVEVDRISVPDTVGTDDTLTVRIWSDRVEGDMFENDSVAVTRGFSCVALSLWADVYEWAGTGEMPPTDLWPMNGDPVTIAPPFYEGILSITVYQPDSSAIEDTVIVVPGDGAFSTRIEDLRGKGWMLESFGSIGEEDTLIAESEIMIEFDEDYTLATSAGCNDCGGGYDGEDDGTLSTDGLACTEKFCSLPEGIMDQEERYIAALLDVASFRITEERLELFYDDWRRVLNFNPVPSP